MNAIGDSAPESVNYDSLRQHFSFANGGTVPTPLFVVASALLKSAERRSKDSEPSVGLVLEFQSSFSKPCIRGVAETSDCVVVDFTRNVMTMMEL